MDLLSNRVLEPFLSRIDGKITKECLEAQGHQWRRERTRNEQLGVGLHGRGGRKAVGEECERYKYPPTPNGQLSRGSAASQLQQCRSAAVLLFRCGTATPGNIVKVNAVKS